MQAIKRKILPALCFALMLFVFAFIGIRAGASGIYSVRIDDLDDCLSEKEEAYLRDIMQETADKVKLNIGFCITADLGGRTDVSYSDFYRDQSFGRGKDSIVLVLLNRHGKREYSSYVDQIATSGDAVKRFSTTTIENRMFKKIYEEGMDDTGATSPDKRNDVYDGYSSANFYQSGVAFCRAIEECGNPFLNFILDNLIALGLAALIGFVIAWAVGSGTKKSYSKKKPISAATYIDRSKTNMKRQVDQFVREYTTSVRVSSSSGGRGGGGGHSGGGGGGGRGR